MARSTSAPESPSDVSAASRVGLVSAVALAAGNMIGVGVFTSLGFQIAGLNADGSNGVFPIMLLWITGALLAFCGAVSYSELTAMFPRSGGEYNILGRTYGPAFGFLGGWVSAVVAFPAPVAVAAKIMGSYACAAFGLNPGLENWIATGAVVSLTAAHLFTVRMSGAVQTGLTLFKVLLILVFIVCGFLLPAPQPVSWLPVEGDAGRIFSSPWFMSLTYVLYAYTGWNAVGYVTSELKRPQRTLPLAMLIAACGVGVIYTLLNAAFLNAAPLGSMAGVPDVASAAALPVFGESGARLMSGLICFGLLSTISAMTWAGPRVAMSMGQDYPLLAPLAIANRAGVPVAAILLQGVLAMLMIFSANPESILTYTNYCLQLMVLLAVWGVVHLRIRRPELDRPYRAWGYPWTTVTFCVFICFVLGAIMKERPTESLYGMGVVVLGLVAWFPASASTRGGS